MGKTQNDMHAVVWAACLAGGGDTSSPSSCAHRHPLLQLAGWVLLWLFVAFSAPQTGAAPFVPEDDQQVLERLPGGAAAQQARELRRLRTQPTVRPDQWPTAARLAWNYIAQGRSESDPRLLGYAQAALAPWWDAPGAPPELWILRATIRQNRHDFTGALADLDQALAANPASAQAWLTRATVLQVCGRYDEAKRCLLPLVRLAPGLVSTASTAGLASLTGQAARSYDLLRSAVDHEKRADSETRLWALTLLAEIAARLGRAAEAETMFHQALALGPRDAYLLGAYADFLLDHDRAGEVVSLLRDETRADGLLLRLALAELGEPRERPDLESHVTLLQARFDASQLRGDCIHRREQARFALHLRHRPREALELALANWQVQREPADARVLLEAALEAGEKAAAVPARDWLSQNRLEDVHLAKLVKELATQP